MKQTRRAVLESSAGALAIAVAGCLERGGDPSSDEPAAARGEDDPDAGRLGTPASSVTVTVTSQPYPAFEPQVVHVVPGGTVEWFVETGRHDVTAYHEDGHGPHRTPDGIEPWGSDYLTGIGSTFEHRFERPGVYDYVDTQQVCTSHEVAGNLGRVVVGWPDPDGEPAMAPPQAALPTQAARAIEAFNEETRPVLEAGP